MVDSPYWNIDEIAALYSVPRNRIERLIHNKDIPAIKFGDKLWRIPKTAQTKIETLLNGGEAKVVELDETSRTLISTVLFAEYFGVQISMINGYCRNGRIKSYRLGSRWGILPSEIDRISREGM